MSKELEVAIKAAKEAGKILKDNFQEINTVTFKEGGSMVTEVDKLSERRIISRIKEAFPKHSINAEESGLDKKASEYIWLIDPLDGTTNYATHVPFFAVSIALVRGNEIQLGAVYDPIHEDLYTAEVRRGATLNDEPIRVSETQDLKMAKVGYARPSKVKEEFINLFSKVEAATRTPKILGSMTLHNCYVGIGNSDAAICLYPNPWDVAAAVLIVKEAGGKVTDFSGNDWSVTSKNTLASNGKIHDELLAVLNN